MAAIEKGLDFFSLGSPRHTETRLTVVVKKTSQNLANNQVKVLDSKSNERRSKLTMLLIFLRTAAIYTV